MKHISRWLMALLAVLVLPGMVFPALAQEGETITLVPFTSENFGIQGVVPEGWSEAAPGVYARGAHMGDLTSLIQQAAPGMTSDALAAMLLPSLNLTELPEPSGTLETDFYTWTLYDIAVEVSGLSIKVALALAEDEAGTTLVLLQALADDFDALHEAVYLPAVEALAPLGGKAAEADVFEGPDGLYTVPIPTNWTAEDRGEYAYLYSPDELLAVSIVVVPETDPEAALAAAWAVVQPDFARELADTFEIPTSDLDSFFLYNYKTENDEETIDQVEVRTLGELSYVLLFRADLTEAQQRAAQLQIVDSGFKIAAVEETSIAGVEPLPLSDALVAELEAYIVDAMDRFKTPGASMAIVRDGEVVYASGFGVLGPEGGPVTPDTYMMIGSTTKTMTTLLMAQMVDDGAMAWDTPVTDILPSFKVADPDVTAAITMENLVCACTGVPRRDVEIIFNSAGTTAESMIESLSDFEFFTDFG
ncbi:MAG: beta-lactamase family protein, partial [Anaerolineae bacterium]|nr:beta-lactamase family protein [Anaerolineae bacterium]